MKRPLFMLIDPLLNSYVHILAKGIGKYLEENCSVKRLWEIVKAVGGV